MPAVNRIDGMTPGGAPEYNRKVTGSDDAQGSQFTLLSDELEGVIYEPGSAPEAETKTIAQIREEIAREEAAAARANMHSRFDGPGVEVSLSTDGMEATAKPTASNQSIGEILKDTWRAIREFFSSIWNGGDEKPAAVSETEEESAKQAADQPAARTLTDTRSSSSTPEEITKFLADYGGAKLAKNSDLLTQYDRTGHIVSIAPSDRRRILKGDGNIRRY